MHNFSKPNYPNCIWRGLPLRQEACVKCCNREQRLQLCPVSVLNYLTALTLFLKEIGTVEMGLHFPQNTHNARTYRCNHVLTVCVLFVLPMSHCLVMDYNFFSQSESTCAKFHCCHMCIHEEKLWPGQLYYLVNNNKTIIKQSVQLKKSQWTTLTALSSSYTWYVNLQSACQSLHLFSTCLTSSERAGVMCLYVSCHCHLPSVGKDKSRHDYTFMSHALIF